MSGSSLYFGYGYDTMSSSLAWLVVVVGVYTGITSSTGGVCTRIIASTSGVGGLVLDPALVSTLELPPPECLDWIVNGTKRSVRPSCRCPTLIQMSKMLPNLLPLL